ncbi:L-threonine synthase [Methanocella conradii HZ254]|uniref:Threonine synthase n=1 Tax=Methanocella conradii (strain DSM 24694 / JCM 17849 / CGMCC 1.5162 / HZ254) TaxID=1041930 RepID=H8IAS9_METCZ|nr:threonine synthase [Methanocella conradii]AFD00584.1 L-threonine synthase [Methanocella conradii HZ254]
MYHLECIKCGAKYGPDKVIYTCSKCGGLLDVVYDYSEIRLSREDLKGPLSVWKYKALLPVSREPVTLKEGGTPIYHLRSIGKEVGLREAYAKHEGMNPSGSFKDRGMTVGVTKALELGMKSVACASTGNTSASLAVYGARAGIPVIVLLPSGKVALGKVAQALMHGAKVISIKGNFDDALRLVRELCVENGIYLLNSINPYRLEGQKTIGFEIVDYFGWEVPDRIILPVGNAGNITAIFKGLSEMKRLGIIDRVPKMTGIQAEGSAPIAKAIKSGAASIAVEEHPETVATAIRIGDPVNAVKALNAIRASGGTAETVTDEEILAAQKMLATKEGIGVEPASAASVAGLIKLRRMGVIEKDEHVVCVVTGHLLKDPETVIKNCDKPIEVEATKEAIEKALGMKPSIASY